MAINEAPYVYVEQFSNTFKTLAQQSRSILESAVERDTDIVGETKNIDFIGKREAKQRVNRINPTPINPQTYFRRKLHTAPYDDGDIMVQSDKIRMLADPQSPVMQEMVKAMNRAKDRVIYNAMLGYAETKEGMVALPNTQTILHGDTGITKAKMIHAFTLFQHNEVKAEYGEQLFTALSADQLNDLLNDDTLTSQEQNTVFSLQTGTFATGQARLFGFNVLFWEGAPYVADGQDHYQVVPFWAKSGVTFGVGQEITAQAQVDPSMSFDVRVYTKMDIGAVRSQEVKVVAAQCIANNFANI